MKKIPSLFKRDYNGNRQVYDEVVPGCEWVLNGEGIATEKVDGTCCMVRSSKLYKRYTVKGKRKPPPEFEPATEIDPNTGKQEGWVPVGDGADDAVHREAFESMGHQMIDGTYELLGPKIQGNPYGDNRHWLCRHGSILIQDAPKGSFESVRAYLETHRDIEGIVWHHPDGRMCKIKRRDFGFEWPMKKELNK